MKALAIVLVILASLKSYAGDNQNLFDPDKLLRGLTTYSLPYKLVSCRSQLGSSKAKLNWYFNSGGRIAEIDFVGLDNNAGWGREFDGLFPFNQNAGGFNVSVTTTGVRSEQDDMNVRATKELIVSADLKKIEYRQAYHEGDSSLDCLYVLETGK